MTAEFEIIVGTYHNFFLGYKINKVEKQYTLEKSFATRSHVGSVRSVACRKNYLASAGADGTISLYDLKSRKESGKLTHHDGNVNCIAFTPDATHILSCSIDGSIGIVRCGNWQLEKQFNSAHEGSDVNAIAVHPSSKLALSVGSDGSLRTWNLVKGRKAYTTNLMSKFDKRDAKNVTILHWSPNGDTFVLAANTKLFSVSIEGIWTEVIFNCKIVSLDFIDEDLIITGHDDGTIKIYKFSNKSTILELKGHDTRVKCLQHRDKYIVSASSSGEIKLWKFVKEKLKLLTSTNCNARITCMTLT